ncbi:MAG: GNAT family N-acetyltransferase [Phenylobacterium sp.]|nr:aminoglycoside 6'-N-acetyltransferase [Phenylobacterium sp.]MCG9915041.1 GNAT family N-acetyltransferase [Phenylobacterium sp.]
MRASLWPSSPVDQHEQESRSALTSPDNDKIVLVAVDLAGVVCGFTEAALRHDYVNGCHTSPVAFLEGIYVVPERRGSGAARALTFAVEAWGRRMGCTEFASDALIDNLASHDFHVAVGFEETERVVYFRKRL